MKKGIILLLVLLFVCSLLTSCGPQTEASPKATDQNVVQSENVTEAENDATEAVLSGEDASFSDIGEKSEEYIRFVLAENYNYYKRSETSDNYLINWDITKGDRTITPVPFAVTIDGNIKIQSGTMYSEIVKSGYSIDSESEEREISSGYMSFFWVTNESTGKKFYSNLANTSDTTKAAKDCEIYAVEFEADKCPDFDYKGVKLGDSFADVIQKVGLPTNYISITDKDNTAEIVVEYSNPDTDTFLKLKFDYNEGNNDTSLTYLRVSK